MVKKSFRVTVCFDLHQVTCPGVWLCPKGKIFITLSLFKCLETTKQVKPVFPLKFHQRFVFDKIFDSVSSLGELETEMSSRNVRLELVQVFKGKLKMVTLAVFQAALTNILYPSVSNGSDSGAAEVDLLFESCQPFPGIIAPKAEVTTRSVIEELRLCPKFTEGPVNPTLIPSAMKCGSAKLRQKTVCHKKPSSECTCLTSGNVNKKRPKTTGGPVSPYAKSMRCKGFPPPRPKTIEGGGDTGAESDSNGDNDQRYPSSDSLNTNKDQPVFSEEQVEADVHYGPSDTEQTSPRKSRSGSSQRMKARNDKDQQRYESREGSKKAGCNCFTCDQCKETIKRLQVPWKVYAAPTSLEHCFCHSKAEFSRNEELRNQNHRRHEARTEQKNTASQNVTTQTSAICRCQEPNAFSSGKQSRSANQKIPPEFKNQRGQDNQKKQNTSNPLKFLCPCGCIDMSPFKQNENHNSKSRGSVEKRNQKSDKSNNCCKNQGSVQIKTTLTQNLPSKHAAKFNKCFCSKSKPNC